ncbi:hypothetical protein JCM4914_33090 [Streptomyces platensis subsp. malvinus]
MSHDPSRDLSCEVSHDLSGDVSHDLSRVVSHGLSRDVFPEVIVTRRPVNRTTPDHVTVFTHLSCE